MAPLLHRSRTLDASPHHATTHTHTPTHQHTATRRQASWGEGRFWFPSMTDNVKKECTSELCVSFVFASNKTWQMADKWFRLVKRVGKQVVCINFMLTRKRDWHYSPMWALVSFQRCSYSLSCPSALHAGELLASRTDSLNLRSGIQPPVPIAKKLEWPTAGLGTEEKGRNFSLPGNKLSPPVP